MLTQEKQQTKSKIFSETEISKKSFIFPKIGFFLIFSVILGIGIYLVFNSPKNDEGYLLDLMTRIENGEELPSGEQRDYCHLMAILRDSISPKCVCVLDGINWDNPPKNPEKLPEVWEEFFKPNNEGNRRFFRHKIYPKIEIDFDLKDSNGNERPHWHRENPNSSSKKDQYLDKDCNIINRYHKNSHLYIRK